MATTPILIRVGTLTTSHIKNLSRCSAATQRLQNNYRIRTEYIYQTWYFHFQNRDGQGLGRKTRCHGTLRLQPVRQRRSVLLIAYVIDLIIGQISLIDEIYSSIYKPETLETFIFVYIFIKFYQISLSEKVNF